MNRGFRAQLRLSRMTTTTTHKRGPHRPALSSSRLQLWSPPVSTGSAAPLWTTTQQPAAKPQSEDTRRGSHAAFSLVCLRSRQHGRLTFGCSRLGGFVSCVCGVLLWLMRATCCRGAQFSRRLDAYLAEKTLQAELLASFTNAVAVRSVHPLVRACENACRGVGTHSPSAARACCADWA